MKPGPEPELGEGAIAQVTTALPPTYKQALKLLAKRDGKNVSQVLRDMVVEIIAKENPYLGGMINPVTDPKTGATRFAAFTTSGDQLEPVQGIKITAGEKGSKAPKSGDDKTD